MPTHELKGRGTPVLVKDNRFAPDRIPRREITNPLDLVAVNILEDDRRNPRVYVPNVVVAASTVIKHENNREAALVILQVVLIPAATVMSGAMARSAPLAMVRIVIPMASTIVTI